MLDHASSLVASSLCGLADASPAVRRAAAQAVLGVAMAGGDSCFDREEMWSTMLGDDLASGIGRRPKPTMRGAGPAPFAVALAVALAVSQTAPKALVDAHAAAD